MPRLARRATDPYLDTRPTWSYPGHTAPDIVELTKQREQRERFVTLLVVKYTIALVLLTLLTGAIAWVVLP